MKKVKKSISRKKLDKLILNAEGDWDFLLFLLKDHWKNKK